MTSAILPVEGSLSRDELEHPGRRTLFLVATNREFDPEFDQAFVSMLDYYTKGRQNKKFPGISGVLPSLFETNTRQIEL